MTLRVCMCPWRGPTAWLSSAQVVGADPAPRWRRQIDTTLLPPHVPSLTRRRRRLSCPVGQRDSAGDPQRERAASTVAAQAEESTAWVARVESGPAAVMVHGPLERERRRTYRRATQQNQSVHAATVKRHARPNPPGGGMRSDRREAPACASPNPVAPPRPAPRPGTSPLRALRLVGSLKKVAAKVVRARQPASFVHPLAFAPRNARPHPDPDQASEPVSDRCVLARISGNSTTASPNWHRGSLLGPSFSSRPVCSQSPVRPA